MKVLNSLKTHVLYVTLREEHSGKVLEEEVINGELGASIELLEGTKGPLEELITQHEPYKDLEKNAVMFLTLREAHTYKLVREEIIECSDAAGVEILAGITTALEEQE